MDKALSPYIKGGGAKTYERELRKTYGFDEDGTGTVGGFQAMTQDALTVLNDIPFSIPAYFAILGRAIVTLEGVALTGNPEYGIIMESYPFIARKLLKEDTPLLQQSLQELLYSGDGSGGGVKFSRLIALVNSAGGNSADAQEGMIDLDAKFSDGFGLKEGLRFVMGGGGANLRGLLKGEALTIGDLVFRNIVRKQFGEAGRLGPQVRYCYSRSDELGRRSFAFLNPSIPHTLRLASLVTDSGASRPAPAETPRYQ